MAEMDLYRCLEVLPNAHPEVIDAAYKALTAVYRPEQSGETDHIALLDEAFKVLGNPAKRAEYDRLLSKPLQRQIGNYQIMEQIADGSFGRTYKAKHILTGELVCIKQCSHISPINEALVIKEAKRIWDLRHFSIPVMRDILKFNDGSVGLVMSYIPGPTIEQIVKRNGKIDAEHVAWIAERLINVLMYVHYQHIVHGDVEPKNVILQLDNHTLVLVDFGLHNVRPTVATGTDNLVSVFTAPEFTAGLPLIPESDLYSLGMVMIYALNGGNTRSTERKEIPTGTPRPLVDFIRRLVSEDPFTRPNWDKEDLTETISRVRTEAFGRDRSGMKPLTYS